ncbi:hypothetical protein TB2_007669 [Malus domestica]
MLSQDPSLSKTLNPSLFLLTPFFNLLHKTLTLKPLTAAPKNTLHLLFLPIPAKFGPQFHIILPISQLWRELRSIKGNAECFREVKENARRKSKRLAESNFYRLKNHGRKYTDNFTDDELQQIRLGYDWMVRFMEKDNPNLRHPHDWYKYGE